MLKLVIEYIIRVVEFLGGINLNPKKKLVIFFISIFFLNLTGYILADNQNIRFKEDQTLFVKGYNAYKVEKYDKAIVFLNELENKKEYQNSYTYNYTMGIIKYNLGENNESKTFLKKTMNIYPYAIDKKEFSEIYEEIN